MRIALVLLALSLGACAAQPMYEDSKRVAKIDKLREDRDLCLTRNVARFDNLSASPARVGSEIAQACADKTTSLVEFAIPEPSEHDRQAFQKEAAFRATGFVVTARRTEGDPVSRKYQAPPPVPQQPTPLLYPLGTGVL